MTSMTHTIFGETFDLVGVEVALFGADELTFLFISWYVSCLKGTLCKAI